MTYTDEQCEQFYKTMVADNNNLNIAKHYGKVYLERLERAGYRIEFPVCIEYKVHPVADPGSDRMWALYKYVNGERHTWIADFARKVHAEDLRDLLTNDLHPSGEC